MLHVIANLNLCTINIYKCKKRKFRNTSVTILSSVSLILWRSKTVSLVYLAMTAMTCDDAHYQ
jgi:hypothetical protein